MPVKRRLTLTAAVVALTLLPAIVMGFLAPLAIVPVAADGTIALITSAGATDVTVDVTGYYLAGDQPNAPAVG